MRVKQVVLVTVLIDFSDLQLVTVQSCSRCQSRSSVHTCCLSSYSCFSCSRKCCSCCSRSLSGRNAVSVEGSLPMPATLAPLLAPVFDFEGAATSASCTAGYVMHNCQASAVFDFRGAAASAPCTASMSCTTATLRQEISCLMICPDQ